MPRSIKIDSWAGRRPRRPKGPKGGRQASADGGGGGTAASVISEVRGTRGSLPEGTSQPDDPVGVGGFGRGPNSIIEMN